MILSFLNKILISLGIITVISLLLLWLVLKPKYEASILTERLTVYQQIQKSSLDNLDYTITGWSHIPQFIISQVTEKPNEGETILRSMMTLHPEIIQIRIHSYGLSDELKSQNISYPPFNLEIADSVFIRSNIDSSLYIAWLNRAEMPAQTFIMRTLFQVHQIPFLLTIVWDAKRLTDNLTELPLNKDCSLGIYSPSGVIMQNTSSFKIEGVLNSIDTSRSINVVQEETRSWRVLAKAFRSVQFWMVLAIPEENFTGPVNDFLNYSTALILGLMSLSAILGWLLSCQMKRFLKKMKNNVC